MRKEFVVILSSLVATLLLAIQVITPSLAQPIHHGEAYARTNIANPLGMVVAWTNSGAEVVFTNLIQNFQPRSAAWTCCGWHVGSHNQWSWHTGTQGHASHHWYLFHGICLPIIGCIVDQQVTYDAGVFIKIIKIGAQYYCDSYPTGQYSYLITKGQCI